LRKHPRSLKNKRAGRKNPIRTATALPDRARELLTALGFSLDDPAVGQVETGDTEAIEALLGSERAAEVRADANRLFDASGRAALALDLDTFALTVTLRTGTTSFASEDVFRWLRWFRDMNLFGDSIHEPSHPDRVRDLRRAPREPARVLRGVLRVPCLPAHEHFCCAAAGVSADDFHLLGRSVVRAGRRSSSGDASPTLLLHVTRGTVTDTQALDVPLTHLHVADDGAIWGLSEDGAAVRLQKTGVRAFRLERPGGARAGPRAARWCGIGGTGSRVLAFGAGALLAFDRDRFVPFEPQPELEEHETVVALCAHGDQIWMLVCGSGVGAVARFDGHAWLPIAEKELIEGELVDLDVWRGVAMVLDRRGEVWQVESTGDVAPHRARWNRAQPAFRNDALAERPAHSVRGFDGGTLLGSDGGVLVVGSGEAVFHASDSPREAARVARVGGGGLVALCGPNAWLWSYGFGGEAPKNKPDEVRDVRDAFWVIDTRDW
jgi:hypothetical protein